MRSHSIAVRERMSAAPEEVWALISEPGHLAQCHPFCRSNTVRQWPGPGSQDTIEYYNGRVVDRHFTNWIEGEGYDIEVSDANGPSASVSWRIEPGESECRLLIQLVPRFQSQAPLAYRWAVAGIARPLLERYLRSVTKGIAWRVTTGKPVGRNQFGSHIWFSGRVKAE